METAIRCSIVLMALLIVNAVPFAWAREQAASVEALLRGDDAIEARGADSENSPVVTQRGLFVEMTRRHHVH